MMVNKVDHRLTGSLTYFESSSSSSSKYDYYLGGTIALLLQDHRTMSTKSVCSSQYGDGAPLIG